MSFGKGGGGSSNSGALMQAQDEARKTALRTQINSMFGIGDDPAAAEARASLTGEEDKVGQAFRDYYKTQNERAYGDAQRALKFNVANTGNTNGSGYADAKARLDENNAIGGTRIADAVQQAINGLRTSRDQTRLQATNLVNAGSGSDAVSAAQQGIQNSLNTAQAATKQDLFSDLFANVAFANNANNQAAQNQALLARYRQPGGLSVGGYSPSSGTTVQGA